MLVPRFLKFFGQRVISGVVKLLGIFLVVRRHWNVRPIQSFDKQLLDGNRNTDQGRGKW